MKTIEVSFELNGFPVGTDVEPHLRLLDLLRDVLGETGTKEACGEGDLRFWVFGTGLRAVTWDSLSYLSKRSLMASSRRSF